MSPLPAGTTHIYVRVRHFIPGFRQLLQFNFAAISQTTCLLNVNTSEEFYYSPQGNLVIFHNAFLLLSIVDFVILYNRNVLFSIKDFVNLLKEIFLLEIFSSVFSSVLQRRMLSTSMNEFCFFLVIFFQHKKRITLPSERNVVFLLIGISSFSLADYGFFH